MGRIHAASSSGVFSCLDSGFLPDFAAVVEEFFGEDDKGSSEQEPCGEGPSGGGSEGGWRRVVGGGSGFTGGEECAAEIPRGGVALVGVVADAVDAGGGLEGEFLGAFGFDETGGAGGFGTGDFDFAAGGDGGGKGIVAASEEDGGIVNKDRKPWRNEEFILRGIEVEDDCGFSRGGDRVEQWCAIGMGEDDDRAGGRGEFARAIESEQGGIEPGEQGMIGGDDFRRAGRDFRAEFFPEKRFAGWRG